MKKLILLLMALMPLKSFTQVTYSFENGSPDGWMFFPAGRWAADTYQAIGGNYSLHHIYNSSTAGSDAATFSISGLCLQCSAVTWSFTLRHGYDPSASNKWSFVLASDLPAGSLTTSTGFNGYVVAVNLTGNDDTLRLWKVADKTLTRVISTVINWEEDIGISSAVRITVTRYVDGNWKLRVETITGTLIGEWAGNNPSVFTPRSSGVIYCYTASADQLLWLDDVVINGLFIPDTSAPVVTAAEALTDKILRVKFDEEPVSGITDPASVSVSSGQSIKSIEKISAAVYNIIFNESLPNKTENNLMIRNVCDGSGNCASLLSFAFTPSFAEACDVVISEIMFDPVPSVKLPEEEYVEITNISEYPFYTSGWMLVAGSDTSFFPDVKIDGGEIAILCSYSDTADFRSFGEVIGLKSFPSLNDSGEKIALRDNNGMLIYALVFGPDLYHNDLRSGGGWSAELTDTNNPFNSPDAWIASQDPSGGTPGRTNSVVNSSADNSCPQLISAYPVNKKSLILIFDETMCGAFNTSDWNIERSEVVTVRSLDICDMVFSLEFEEPLKEDDIYKLLYPGALTDFAGNKPCQDTVYFGLPVEASVGGMLFNEILFNPVSPCGDYLEIYNNSSGVFDLSEYFFSSTDASSGEESSVSVVCSFPRLILPGELIVLTTGKEALVDHYPCATKEKIVETVVLPSMPDDEGVITLYNKRLEQIDKVAYNSSMHLVFISDDEGISLEKVSPSLPSGIRSNWHSASESCLWGTPGTANSVLLPLTEDEEGMTLSGERVSPDGDGYEDVVSINVMPGGDDNVVTVSVYNDRGVMVRHLAERFYAGRSAVFVWDGTNDNSECLSRGLYLIEVTSYNASGKTHRWKKVCAVLYK